MDFKLDAKTTALVAIDLQHGTVARQLAPHATSDVVKRSVKLADSLRAAGGTIAFVNVLVTELLDLPVDAAIPRPAELPPNVSDLVPEVHLRSGDLRVTKRQWGAFYGTNLEQELRRRNIRTIVMTGIATNFGVESTARQAFDMGFAVVFAEDAMTSMGEAHAFSVAHIFPRMGRVRSCEQIAAAWG